MQELEKFYRVHQQKIAVLLEEIKEIQQEQKDKVKNGDNTEEKDIKPRMSKKALQPLTRIRKDVEAIKGAQKNPDITFIEDRISDIYRQ